MSYKARLFEEPIILVYKVFMKDLFLKHFAEAIERSNEINIADDFKTYEEWDSLAILSLLAVVDEEYGVNFSSSQLEKMKTVGDIYEFILYKSK